MNAVFSYLHSSQRSCLRAACLASLLLAIVSPVQADYSGHPAARPLIDRLVKEHAFEQAEVEHILSLASTEQRILDSMANAAEKTKTWNEYRSGFLSSLRIEKGVEFLATHKNAFDEVERQYGVPREIIAAVLGVETNYGGYTGKANVLNALATLAFEHPRRSSFFSEELVEYIILSREQGWQVDQQLGSYAGAMGMSQFMPSNYRRLAIDGDGDGRANLFQVEDAIASVANYFVHHGWRPGEPVASRVAVSRDFDESFIRRSIKPRDTVEVLEKAGYFPQENVEPDTRATIVRFNDKGGDEFWMGYNNFYVISRYNPRSKYAMAVYHLSDEIRERYQRQFLTRAQQAQ